MLGFVLVKIQDVLLCTEITKACLPESYSIYLEKQLAQFPTINTS